MKRYITLLAVVLASIYVNAQSLEVADDNQSAFCKDVLELLKYDKENWDDLKGEQISDKADLKEWNINTLVDGAISGKVSLWIFESVFDVFFGTPTITKYYRLFFTMSENQSDVESEMDFISYTEDLKTCLSDYEFKEGEKEYDKEVRGNFTKTNKFTNKETGKEVSVTWTHKLGSANCKVNLAILIDKKES